MPQVSGSLRMNFLAFGFGVGSTSAILGMLGYDLCVARPIGAR